jgi:hypothetical protein
VETWRAKEASEIQLLFNAEEPSLALLRSRLGERLQPENKDVADPR